MTWYPLRSYQVVEHSSVKVWILLHGGSILHAGCICSLGYFPFQSVVHNWSIKGCGKVHIKDPLLLIGKSSLCSDSRFHLKKYVTMTIYLMSNRQWWKSMCSRGVVKQNKLSSSKILSGRGHLRVICNALFMFLMQDQRLCCYECYLWHHLSIYTQTNQWFLVISRLAWI